ncbi:MAG: hypothetical protein L6Q76_04985 [Polyangiaceae bacterium]|nr:hypothetical protein [Polyangiaceae bacterium]
MGRRTTFQQQWRKELQRDSRARTKGRIKQARDAVKGAKSEGKARLAAVREACIETIEAATRALNDARQALTGAREKSKNARSKCTANKRATREQTVAHVAAAKEKLEDARRDQASERIFGDQKRYVPAENPAKKAAMRRERREEGDDFVVQNLSPELIPLWNRVKRKFSGTPHDRWEEFLEWVEENPDAVSDARDAAMDDRRLDQEFAREQAAHYGFSLETQAAPKQKKQRKKSAAERTQAMFGPDVMLQKGRHSYLAQPPPLRLTHSPNDGEEAQPRVESGHLPF